MRVNTIVMSGILPFNFGMDHNAWLTMWKESDEQTRETLIGSNPEGWTQECIDAVNQKAREESELYHRLMALSDDEFQVEMARLRQEKK